MTWHQQARLKVATKSVQRFKESLKETFRRGRGRNLGQFIQELKPMLRGWINYFKLSETKDIFEELDGWLRRKLRRILWRQWKRPKTRIKRLINHGLKPDHAWKSASNGRGPW